MLTFRRFDVSTFRRFDVSTFRLALGAFVGIALVCLSHACRRDPDTAAGDARADIEQQKPVELLVFPDEVRVEDASLNDFLERAMADCAGGDYEKFRLLWSVRQEPLPRDEFEQGWQAVEEIRIRALKKVMLAPDPEHGLDKSEEVYVILADVALDPTHPVAQRSATGGHREVVLMIIREHDQWRLARAPKPMRIWIKKLVETPGTPQQDPTGPRDGTDEQP